MTWVCWSRTSKIEDKKIHLQSTGDRFTTLCGIFQTREWSFDSHDNTDSVNCKRCLLIMKKTQPEG